MRPEISPEPAVPQVGHHPLIAQLYAQQTAKVAHSPSSEQAQGDRGRRGQSENTTGSSPSDPAVDSQHAANVELSTRRLNVAEETVGQLADLITSIVDSLRESPIGLQSHRANHRILLSAAGAAKDIIEHAQSAGKPLFNMNVTLLSGRTLPATSRSALAAYSASHRRSGNSPDPPSVRRAFQVIEIHLVGPKGVLNTLQELADNGPFASEDAANSVGKVLEILHNLSEVVTDAKARLRDPPSFADPHNTGALDQHA